MVVEVIPNGPACHTGEYSCFFHPVKENQVDYEPSIIEQVMQEVETRKTKQVENSYTNYLYEKGVDKIGKKVIEEAGEVVIAAKNNDKAELTSEVSDLLYHTFVMMANCQFSHGSVGSSHGRSSRPQPVPPYSPDVHRVMATKG